MPRVLHQPFSLPDSRGIDELHGNPVEGCGFGNKIARCPGNIGDNRTVLIEEPVEQTALSDIRTAHDRERESVVHQFPVSEARDQHGERGRNGFEAPQNFLGWRDAHVILREIDAGFEQSDQLQQLFFDRLKTPRNRAPSLLRGDARLIQRRGLDQIADRLGLRQIYAAIQISPQSELARVREPRPGLAGSIENVTQNDGSAVAGNLDHIFTSVGSRRREIGDNNMRIHRVSLRVGKLGEYGGPRLPGNGSPGWTVRREIKDFPGDRARFAAGDAYDADSTSSGRRRYGRDGVAQLQSGFTSESSAVPVASAARRPVVAIAAEGPPASAVVSAILFRPGLGRDNRLGKRLHVRGHNHHLPDGTDADAFTAHFGFAAQRQMQNAAFPAVHGAEVERDARFLDALGRRQRTHPQFFDSQDAIIVRIEAHP